VEADSTDTCEAEFKWITDAIYTMGTVAAPIRRLHKADAVKLTTRSDAGASAAIDAKNTALTAFVKQRGVVITALARLRVVGAEVQAANWSVFNYDAQLAAQKKRKCADVAAINDAKEASRQRRAAAVAAPAT
jgi:hypothetical protein